MDLWTIVIAVLGISAFVVPFVLFNRSKKNHDKGTVITLKEYAAKNNWELSDFEVENKIVLGVDNPNRIAFFLEDIEGKSSNIIHVDLNEISLCRVDRKTRLVDGDSITERVDLVFSPKSKKNEAVVFNLFDENLNQRLSNELAFAKKWVDIFNRRVK